MTNSYKINCIHILCEKCCIDVKKCKSSPLKHSTNLINSFVFGKLFVTKNTVYEGIF